MLSLSKRGRDLLRPTDVMKLRPRCRAEYYAHPVASGLFIAVLLPLIAASIAISLRERPLRRLLPTNVDEMVILLASLLLFNVVCVGLLVRFGTTLS
jgi:hypothetical protein